MLLFRIIKNGWYKKINLFGFFTIYKRELIDLYCHQTYLYLFKTKENRSIKLFYLFGIRLYKENKKPSFDDIKSLFNRLLKDERTIHKLQLIAANLHPKTFSEFKNSNNGQDIVLIGSGPTLNFFSPQNHCVNIKYCALNKAFTYDKVKYDYLFTNDFGFLSLNDVTEEFINYEGNNCIKFLGDHNGKRNWQIPESLCLKIKNCRRYKTNAWTYPSEFAFNIDTEIIGNFCTISLQAMQFLLYTNPKRVFLVGIDTTNNGHFSGSEYDEAVRNGEKVDDLHRWSARDWGKLKDFAEIYYPDTEIISVNPIGLKALFRNVYTRDYVKNNQELFEGFEEPVEYYEDIVNQEN